MSPCEAETPRDFFRSATIRLRPCSTYALTVVPSFAASLFASSKSESDISMVCLHMGICITLYYCTSVGGWHETAKGKKRALGKLTGGKYSGLMLYSLSFTERPSVPVTAAMAALAGLYP